MATDPKDRLSSSELENQSLISLARNLEEKHDVIKQEDKVTNTSITLNVTSLKVYFQTTMTDLNLDELYARMDKLEEEKATLKMSLDSTKQV